MKHIMTDMETWATTNDAAIRAIAMAQFDPHNGNVSRSLLIDARPSMDEQISGFRKIDPKTVEWWQAHNQTLLDNLDSHFICAEAHSLQFLIALVMDFLSPCIDLEKGRVDGLLWSRGHFDYGILRNAWQYSGNPRVPWQYWQERDVRTFDELTEKINPEHPHDPLSDVMAQIKQVHNAYTGATGRTTGQEIKRRV